MLSRVRNHFQGAKFARMSSGTYCIIRDLGLVKGGKGMRHHEVLVTFSPRAFRSADLFAGVILLGVTGYVTSVAMSMAEHRLLAWQAAQR